MEKVEDLIDKYYKWLKEKTKIKPINGWEEITTPYVDIHNDYIQIYVKLENDKIIISDGGYILSDLSSSGCSINTDRRKQLLEMILRGFGVKNNKGELIVEANSQNFSMKKHDILQAMLSIHDMFYSVSSTVNTVFADDVSHWFSTNKIRSISQVKFTGKSGFDYMFDFVIPKSEKNVNDRFIKTVNTLNNDKVKTLAFSWLDISSDRPKNSVAYTFINDNNKISADSVSALQTYNITPVLWSNRSQILQELSA